ncbi:MAG: hypothetical protein LBL13_00015 [Bacteroidales bacterium]|jgi:hypothetical protein|nr:hypothetical protein [Bacteroidales bacterium]
MHNIVKKIIFIPKRFHSDNKSSAYSLLKESGYFEFYNSICTKDICTILMQYPDCLNDWLQWSNDKRSSYGWYLKQNQDKKYVIGYISPNYNKVMEYTDIVEACSYFIKQEIEDIRKLK